MSVGSARMGAEAPKAPVATCPSCGAEILRTNRVSPTAFVEVYLCGAAWRWGSGPRALAPCPVMG